MLKIELNIYICVQVSMIRCLSEYTNPIVNYSYSLEYDIFSLIVQNKIIIFHI